MVILSLEKSINEKYHILELQLDEHGIYTACWLFECIYQPFFSTRFLIWLFSKGSSSKESFQRVPLHHQCSL